MINKRGFEFSYGWMFSIIVGSVIIFFAIYGTSKLVSTEHKFQNSEFAKDIETLLSPMDTSYEDGKVHPIYFNVDTKLDNICSNSGVFGEQKIKAYTRSSVGKEWDDTGVPASSYNKYLFSSSTIEGKMINVFSKRFEMPFKVADLLILFSDKDKYCLVNVPNNFVDDFNDLNIANINITDSVSKCPQNSKKICFSSSGCDVDVSLSSSDSGAVSKKGKISRFEGSALMYAAIFSDYNIYECQLKRLSKRGYQLALLYNAKSSTLIQAGCSAEIGSELSLLGDKLRALNSSSDLAGVRSVAEDIGDKNEKLTCKLF